MTSSRNAAEHGSGMLVRRGQRSSRKRATVLLEFAMIMPLFLFLVLFSVDLGRMVFYAGALSDASYVSARAGAQAGDAKQGSISQKAFTQAVGVIPGLKDSKPAVVISGTGKCTSNNSYIIVNGQADVKFITPGLSSLLSIFTGKSAPSTRSWTLKSHAAVLCEVVRG